MTASFSRFDDHFKAVTNFLQLTDEEFNQTLQSEFFLVKSTIFEAFVGDENKRLEALYAKEQHLLSRFFKVPSSWTRPILKLTNDVKAFYENQPVSVTSIGDAQDLTTQMSRCNRKIENFFNSSASTFDLPKVLIDDLSRAKHLETHANYKEKAQKFAAMYKSRFVAEVCSDFVSLGNKF